MSAEMQDIKECVGGEKNTITYVLIQKRVLCMSTKQNHLRAFSLLLYQFRTKLLGRKNEMCVVNGLIRIIWPFTILRNITPYGKHKQYSTEENGQKHLGFFIPSPITSTIKHTTMGLNKD